MRNEKKQFPQRPITSSVVMYLCLRAKRENMDGLEMSEEDLDEMIRDSIDELLDKLPPEFRVKWRSPAQRLDGLSVEQVGNALPLEELEALLQQQKANGPLRESAVSPLRDVELQSIPCDRRAQCWPAPR